MIARMTLPILVVAAAMPLLGACSSDQATKADIASLRQEVMRAQQTASAAQQQATAAQQQAAAAQQQAEAMYNRGLRK